jgi:hypothetical protein
MSVSSAEVNELVNSIDDEGAVLPEPIKLSLSEHHLIKDLRGYYEQ